MANRPTEARAYRAHNTALPLSKLPAYAGVSLGMALCTQRAVSAYGADQALPLIDTIRYDPTLKCLLYVVLDITILTYLLLWQ